MSNQVQTELDYWDSAADDEDVLNNYMANIPVAPCLLEILPWLKPGKVLELGCGIGRLTTEVAYMTDYQVYGTDISQKLLDLTPISGAFYRQGDGRTIPFADETFDSAYSMLVFQHIPDDAKQGYIKELARVLKLGGLFRVQFVEGSHKSSIDYNTSTHDMAMWLIDSGFGLVVIEKGRIYPQWTWITAVKES